MPYLEPDRWYTNYPLHALTSWHVGGPAAWLIAPSSVETLIAALQEHRKQTSPQPIIWLGLGSNVLIASSGIPGIVILTQHLKKITPLTASSWCIEAGVTCSKIAKLTEQAGYLSGAFLAGIPGSLGGALAMNAGAFGGETWKHVQRVQMLTPRLEAVWREVTDFTIHYRHVTHPDLGFLKAELVFQADPHAQQADIRTLLQRRKQTQPIGQRSCGSVFKNPPKHFAGQLIEQAGLKGYRMGGACVSPMHANFIINDEQATPEQIRDLIQYVQRIVHDRSGIQLEPEVRMIGWSAL